MFDLKQQNNIDWFANITQTLSIKSKYKED